MLFGIESKLAFWDLFDNLQIQFRCKPQVYSLNFFKQCLRYTRYLWWFCCDRNPMVNHAAVNGAQIFGFF